MLPDIINEDQSTFILRRHVGDNILLAFELVQHYERSEISPIFVIKVDLRNANDSVEWPYLKPLMRGLGFPLQFVSWIWTCISTVSYNIRFNEKSLHPFEVKRARGTPLT